MANERQLKGLDEIAGHLQTGKKKVRALIAQAETTRIPVKTLPGGRTYYAFAPQLDAWLQEYLSAPPGSVHR